MKNFITASLLCFALGAASLHAEELSSGRKVAETVQDANKSTNRIVWAQLSVFDNGKKLETRRLIIKTFRKNGRDRGMARFMDGLKRGVTSFTIEQGDNEDNTQYIFVPGVGRPRQIASSEKQNDFEDTDLTNEDMGGRKINDYNYTLTKDSTVKIGSESFDCYVLLSTHKNPDARFPRYRSWIDKKTLIPVRVAVYGKDGKLRRQMVAAHIKEVAKGVFMPFYTEVKDLERKHETKIVVQQVKVDDPSLRFEFFTTANMSGPWKEQ